MKHLKLPALFLVLTGILLSGCPGSVEHIAYTPILMSRADFEETISIGSAREIEDPGKIYIKGDRLYLVDKLKGVHIINNSNPASPQKLAFINVIGCIDLEMKVDYMYVNHAEDLVTIHVKSTNNIVVTHREQHAFKELLPPDGWIPYRFTRGERVPETVIVGWEQFDKDIKTID